MDERWFDKFSQIPAIGRLVLGTHLYPLRLLAPDFRNMDPPSLAEVILKLHVPDEILITRNGGLFVFPPESLSVGKAMDEVRAKFSFELKAARLFNFAVCELALCGVVSAPATPAHIGIGSVIDNQAVITKSIGGREIYTDRTHRPTLGMLTGMWPLAMPHMALSKWLTIEPIIKKHERTSRLTQVSTELPTSVASAYSLLSQRQYSEALLDGWNVIEQIIDWYWVNYLTSLSEERRKRLKDTRTYTASVRTEVLETTGRLPSELCKGIHKARKHRNALAHRLDTDPERARETVLAMHKTVEFFCDAKVEPPSDGGISVGW